MIVAAPNPEYGIEARGDYKNSIVFLDRVEQHDCVYADDVAGIIKRLVFENEYKRDGIMCYSGKATVESIHGNVTIIGHVYHGQDGQRASVRAYIYGAQADRGEMPSGYYSWIDYVATKAPITMEYAKLLYPVAVVANISKERVAEELCNNDGDYIALHRAIVRGEI